MTKIILLNIGTTAALLFLILMGYITVTLPLTNTVIISTLLAFTVLAVALFAMGYTWWAKWIGHRMTMFGMAGTAYGLLAGLSTLTFTDGEPLAIAGQLTHELALAFSSTLLGILGKLWIDFNRAVGGDREDAG